MFSSSKSTNTTTSDNKQKETMDSNIYSKLPSLLMTPVFYQNSTWPSYLIKPIYDESDLNKPINNDYYNTVQNLANNITSCNHTTHETQNGTHMFPAIPYYFPTQNVVYDNQNVSIPVMSPTTTTMPSTREHQLWYYQQYQPKMYDTVA